MRSRPEAGSHRASAASLTAWSAPNLPLDEADRPWLGVALATGVGVYLAYLAANRYPAYGAGLYTVAGSQLVDAGYGLPATVPYYTAGGVPFAYPPLAMYGVAVGLDLGVGPFALATFVPGVVTIAYLVPAYLLGRDLLGSRPRGAAAALLLALNPQVLEWHLSAGGLVRAPAALLALSGLYAGLRTFEGAGRRWVAGTAGLFGLTLLTHPTYALFVAVGTVVLWAGLDRSVTGLGRGLAVGVGGVVMAAPWLLAVVANHGPGVFLAAAGTHGGVGGGAAALLAGERSPWLLGLVVLSGVLVARGEPLLLAWLLAVAAGFRQPRFAYLVGSLVVVAVAAPVLVRWVERERDSSVLRAGAAALLVVGSVTGLGMLAYDMTLGGDDWSPEFVDDADVAAMEWAAAETPADAKFVVLGDAAEWFPAVAGRTVLVAPWGVEWVSAATFDRQLRGYEGLSACDTAVCVEGWLRRADARPDYLYVPRGAYTIRGHAAVQGGRLERDLARSTGFEPVFANEGVVVFRVDAPMAAGPSRAPTDRPQGQGHVALPPTC